MKLSVYLQFLLAAALITGSVNAQEGMYFAAGWSIDKLFRTSPLETLVGDFNDHYSTGGFTMNNTLGVPSILQGLYLGMKYGNERLSIVLDLHSHSARSTASYTDTLMKSIDRQIKVSHSGFSMGFGWNLLHEKRFRMGPMFNLTFEQFRIKTMRSSNLIEPDHKTPVDAFYLSTTWKFPISMGGRKFTLDLIPYFQLPFYQISLKKLNEELNQGYSFPYDKRDLKMSPMSCGLIVTMNFSLKGL